MFSYVEWFKETLFNARGKLNPRASSPVWWSNFTDQYVDFKESTIWLDAESSFAERSYCYINLLTERPTCKVCSNFVKYSKVKRGYSEYCSSGCVTKDKSILEKRCRTMVDRYGYVKNFSSEKHRSVAQVAIEEKWGVDHPMKSQILIDKLKNKHINKYGSHYTQTEEYQQKRKKTCIEKYGEDSHMKLPAFRDTIGNLNRKLTDKIKDEIKHDYTSGMAKQTLSEKYDISLSHMNKILTLMGLETDLPQNKINYNKCWKSSAELELVHWLTEFYRGQILTSQRSLIWPYEVDIYLPEIKLAIEFNGTYWHSDIFKDRNYHKNKIEKLESIGIDCVMIFENIWNDRKDLIKSKLLSKILKLPSIGARKCIIKPIDYKILSEFTEIYHLQGSRTSRINYGAYNQGELVACASFNKFRDGLELVRFCSKQRVVGLLPKILKYLKISFNGPVYSFANRCYTYRYKNLYSMNGFSEIDVTDPNYYYVKGKTVLTRNACMKHKLCNFLENFDPNISEYENMKKDGWHRYWDCGNILYKIDI